MAKPVPPNYYGRILVRDLARLREKSGLTQQQVSERMNFPLQKVSRIENGQIPSYHELPALLGVYGMDASDHGPYMELWAKARKRPWWKAYDLPDVRCVRMEDEAHRKVELQLIEVPVLLQTESYARDAIGGQNSSTVAAMVEFRMRRQLRLFTEPLLEYRALIHESVLARGVDQEQLARLIELAGLPNVTIQVVSQAPVDLQLLSSVSLLSFDDLAEPDSAFSETALGLHESRCPGVTSRIKRLLDDAAQHATDLEHALAHIDAVSGSGC